MSDQTAVPERQGGFPDFFYIIFTGHIGNEPALQYTPAGKPVCNLVVYCNLRIWVGDRTITSPLKIRVAVWDKTAENVVAHLYQGSHVLVASDSIKFDPETGAPLMFNRSDGTQGTSLDVSTFTIRFLDRPNWQPSAAAVSVELEAPEEETLFEGEA